MDATNIKNILSLEQVLNSYSVLIIFLFIFIFIVILLLLFNPAGFNKSFGYEFLITCPILIILVFLIKEFIAFSKNPSQSIFKNMSISNQVWFPYAYLALIMAIGLGGCLAMLAVGGIFSDKPPENNTAMILNFVVIIIVLLIGIGIYMKSVKNDDTVLNSLPQEFRQLFQLRTKYTLYFIAFIVFIAILYFVNPWSIMTNYGGPVIFFSLFVGIILVMMITVYQYYFANPSKINLFKDTPGFISYFLKGLYVIGALGLSAGLIYGLLKIMGVFEQNASKPESWGHIILNIFLLCAMLGIIYKLANAGGFLDKNPYYRLIVNTILYIPCLLVIFINNIVSLLGLGKENELDDTKTTPPTAFEIKMLIVSLILLGGYFVWFFLAKPFLRTKYLKQGGLQLINQPISTDILTNVATYETLNGSEHYSYQYAISFWFYLDSFPPSTNASYMKIVPLLSYGQNPTVKYSSKDNTIYITVKQKTDTNSVIDYIHKQEIQIKSENIEKWKQNIQNTIDDVKSMPFGNEVDAEGHRMIYKHPNVLLQKWNQIVLNYNGGTLDVFYNGKLVKSAIEVVPYMKMDMLTVGSENGINGNIANLIYFKEPLDLLTIHTLYNSLKDKNPPSIPENKEKLIHLPNNN